MTTATLINCFQVPAEREEEFLKLWHEADALLRARGSYLTTRLHKALQPDSRYQYINIAELDSVETWKAAITSPEFIAITAQIATSIQRPASTPSPSPTAKRRAPAPGFRSQARRSASAIMVAVCRAVCPTDQNGGITAAQPTVIAASARHG